MSERKSAEIKFRCTPSFKAAAQTAADASGQSLTEYIEAAVWAQHNARLDGLALVGNAIESLRERSGSGAVAACGWNVPPVESMLDADDLAVIAIDASPDEDSGADDHPTAEAPAPTCACRPWEFCTHKAGA